MGQGIKNIGIYMHIPFCRHKCNYCNFLTMISNDRNKIDLYVEYLCKEINLTKHMFEDRIVDTIYFGGGTPSLLSEKNIANILSSLNNNFNIDKDAEITIEINPETIDEKWVKAISKNGINRASVGFQNSNPEILDLIGRKGSLEYFLNSIEYLRKYDIKNISADIILALPKMNVESTIEDAKLICDLDIPHISAYSLILEEKTKLFLDVKKGRVELPNEILEREIYHNFNQYIKDRGYHRYEVSSFCKPGYESRHNSKYWDLSEYIGLGLGASGLINNTRTKNPSKLNEYYQKLDENTLPYNIEYELSLNDMMSEFSFLSIRTSKGIDKQQFYKMFQRDFDTVFDLRKHFEDGLIYLDGNCIKLTEKGYDLSNIVEIDLLL